MCYMIQRLDSYNLLTDKAAEKVPYTIYWLNSYNLLTNKYS